MVIRSDQVCSSLDQSLGAIWNLWHESYPRNANALPLCSLWAEPVWDVHEHRAHQILQLLKVFIMIRLIWDTFPTLRSVGRRSFIPNLLAVLCLFSVDLHSAVCLCPVSWLDGCSLTTASDAISYCRNVPVWYLLLKTCAPFVKQSVKTILIQSEKNPGSATEDHVLVFTGLMGLGLLISLSKKSLSIFALVRLLCICNASHSLLPSDFEDLIFKATYQCFFFTWAAHS